MKKAFYNIKNIFTKPQPKYIYFLFFVIPFLVLFVNRLCFANDFYTLFSVGKYIINNGFPHNLIFTIHSDFTYVPQQWLTCVLFYLIYHYFGRIGMMFFLTFLYAFIFYISYKLCYIVSNKRSASTLFSIIICVLLSFLHVRTRPQMFDYIIILLEFIILEKYFRTDNIKYLFFLPILSILLINFHASSFSLLFIFMIPYFIDTFSFNIFGIRGKKRKRTPLVLSLIAMLISGFINPYGLDMITYIFRSYGNKFINLVVNEMKAPVITDKIGFFVYFVIFSVLFIYFHFKDKQIKARYFFLTLGTIFMTLLNVKSFSYFVISSFFPLADYLSDYFAKDEEFTITKEFKKNYFIAFGFLILITILSFIMGYNNKVANNNSIKKIANYLSKEQKKENKKFRVYTNYDNGSYAEFKGLSVYIDPRAEAFLKSNNKKEDIFKEYYMLDYYDSDIEKFLNKYNFDYIIVSDDERLYYNYLNTNKNKKYKKVYTEKERIEYNKYTMSYLYKRIN